MIRLLDYRANDLYPTKKGWISGLHSLVEKYYADVTRTDAVRVRCLQIMGEIVSANRHMYEQDLLERVVLLHLKSFDADSQGRVRVEGVQV